MLINSKGEVVEEPKEKTMTKEHEEKVEVLFGYPDVPKKVVYEPFLEVGADGHMVKLYLRRERAAFETGRQYDVLKIGWLQSTKEGVKFRFSRRSPEEIKNWPGICFNDQRQIAEERLT